MQYKKSSICLVLPQYKQYWSVRPGGSRRQYKKSWLGREARGGSLKKVASRFARLVSHRYQVTVSAISDICTGIIHIRSRYRYQVSVAVSHYQPIVLAISLVSAYHRYRYSGDIIGTGISSVCCRCLKNAVRVFCWDNFCRQQFFVCLRYEYHHGYIYQELGRADNCCIVWV